jgi:hypothetical protein
MQGRQILGKDAWFRLHQLTMGLALVASLVGLVPLLVDRGVTPLQQRVIHSILGTVTLILAFIQPMLAFFRCAPGREVHQIEHGVI